MLIGGLIEFLGRHQVSIGWGERQLQIATGMGVCALAGGAQSLATTYQRLLSTDIYFAISFAVGVVYELCMIYWVVCFLRPHRGIPDHAPEGSRTRPPPMPRLDGRRLRMRFQMAGLVDLRPRQAISNIQRR